MAQQHVPKQIPPPSPKLGEAQIANALLWKPRKPQKPKQQKPKVVRPGVTKFRVQNPSNLSAEPSSLTSKVPGATASSGDHKEGQQITGPQGSTEIPREPSAVNNKGTVAAEPLRDVVRDDQDSEPMEQPASAQATAAPPSIPNGPPQSQEFPLSPHVAPVQLEPVQVSSPSDDSSDDDELPEPSQLSQLVQKTRPTPEHKLRDWDEETDSDDSSEANNLMDESTQKPAKTLEKQPETVSTIPRPSPLKRNEPASPLQPFERPTQRHKESKLDFNAPENASITVGSQTSSRSSADFLRYHFHDSFLFLDGSVIVRIESAQFKLHRTTLAEHGVWFRERFEKDPDDVYGEVPVYVLDGVIEERDFVNLLKALRDAITYIHQPPDLYTHVSILRAARKLGFAKFEAWAATCLEKMFPVELHPTTTSPYSLSTRLSPIDATAIIPLARECNLGSVLKRLLCELVRTDGFGQTPASSTSTSTSTLCAPPAPSQGANTNDGVTEPPRLSTSDHLLLVQAREKLISLWMSVASPSFPPCSSSGTEAGDTATSPTCKARNPLDDINTYNQVLHRIPASPNSARMPSTTSTEAAGTSTDTEVPKSLFVAYTNDPLGGLQKLSELPWEGSDVPLSAGTGAAATPGMGYCAPCAAARRVFWDRCRVQWWEVFGRVVGC